MTVRRAILLVFFIYDCAKLVFCTHTFALFFMQPSLAGIPALTQFFSLLAPALLFPLMMFFLWFDSARYAPFKGLYCAGKVAGILCVYTGIILYALSVQAAPAEEAGAMLLETGAEQLTNLSYLALMCFADLIITFMLLRSKKLVPLVATLPAP